MARATQRLDLTEVLDVLDTWRRVAWQTSAQGKDTYRHALASARQRLRTGERADGLSSRQSSGCLSELLPRHRRVAQDSIGALPAEALSELAEVGGTADAVLLGWVS